MELSTAIATVGVLVAVIAGCASSGYNSQPRRVLIESHEVSTEHPLGEILRFQDSMDVAAELLISPKNRANRESPVDHGTPLLRIRLTNRSHVRLNVPNNFFIFPCVKGLGSMIYVYLGRGDSLNHIGVEWVPDGGLMVLEQEIAEDYYSVIEPTESRLIADSVDILKCFPVDSVGTGVHWLVVLVKTSWWQVKQDPVWIGSALSDTVCFSIGDSYSAP